MFDLHGEYAAALQDRATVFSAAARPSPGREHLYVPFWALPIGLLIELTMGSLEDRQVGTLSEKVLELKHATVATSKLEGADLDTLTADSPVPFSLKRLWFELHRLEHATYTAQGAIAQDLTTEALELGDKGQPIQEGNADLDLKIPATRRW